jgi:hypothetical protein
MPAIRVAQTPQLVPVLGKEHCGINIIGRIVVKEFVYRWQQALQEARSNCTLAVRARMQTGHQQRCSDALPGDVANDQREPMGTLIYENEDLYSSRSVLDMKKKGLLLRQIAAKKSFSFVSFVSTVSFTAASLAYREAGWATHRSRLACNDWAEARLACP